MLNDTGLVCEDSAQLIGIRDAICEPAAHQVVSIIGDDRFTILLQPQFGPAAKAGEPAQLSTILKLNHFDRQWALSKAWYQLGFIRNDEKFIRMAFNDFFSQ